MFEDPTPSKITYTPVGCTNCIKDPSDLINPAIPPIGIPSLFKKLIVAKFLKNRLRASIISTREWNSCTTAGEDSCSVTVARRALRLVDILKDNKKPLHKQGPFNLI